MTFMEAYLHNGNWKISTELTLINRCSASTIKVGEASCLADEFGHVKVYSFRDNTVILEYKATCKIKRKFYEKVKKLGFVDTRKYRYVLDMEYNVKRLPLVELNTTSVYDGWERIRIPAEWK